MLNAPGMSALLDHYAVEDAFEPGDALIFDKYVLHRSVRLEDGPIRVRMAYALRFSGTDAIYDKSRVDALRFPREAFDYDVGSGFNDAVCTVDGESVYQSRYFMETRTERTVARAIENA